MVSILRTKLFIPPIPYTNVLRPHLVKRLNQGVDKKLTLISAPAGYGKTTLLSSWVQESDRAIAWLSLDAYDNDIGQFSSYLIASLQSIATKIGKDIPSTQDFNETIKRTGTDVYAYNGLSEGERQRVDLALLFTWRMVARAKSSISTNILVLDEIFDSYLDPDATENVIELLYSDIFKGNNIFVISHKNTIGDKFDRNMKFSLKRGYSVIE